MCMQMSVLQTREKGCIYHPLAQMNDDILAGVSTQTNLSPVYFVTNCLGNAQEIGEMREDEFACIGHVWMVIRQRVYPE